MEGNSYAESHRDKAGLPKSPAVPTACHESSSPLCAQDRTVLVRCRDRTFGDLRFLRRSSSPFRAPRGAPLQIFGRRLKPNALPAGSPFTPKELPARRASISWQSATFPASFPTHSLRKPAESQSHDCGVLGNGCVTRFPTPRSQSHDWSKTFYDSPFPSCNFKMIV